LPFKNRLGNVVFDHPCRSAPLPEICQTSLPLTPWTDEKTRRLPGLNPVAAGDWLIVDEVYAAQMDYRETLLETRQDQVYRQAKDADRAAAELLQRVLAEVAVKPGYKVNADTVRCPDGRLVNIDRNAPLITAARLVQEDLVILQKPADEHVLTAAVLCFPASWSLDEKFGRTLTGIHVPVASYDGDIGLRVQRMFDFIKPEMPMWRANYLVYSDPDLFQPRRENARRVVSPKGRHWVRVERQCLLRLPVSQAVVFSIHTYVVPLENLSAADRTSLMKARPIA
jgi:hypothetical protein